jgi:peptidoglycan DL-endopeptidase CwlO
MVASQTSPSEGQAATVLQPVGTSGTQNWMPLSGDQQANASTIVQQALAKKMGIRSAVIAVATAMQESRLQNLNYGDRDSLGLFQQRPSMGWGTAQQILDPQYSADAFLSALQQYQTSNPSWATQPLWTSAQGVQKSGVPMAYAQWEGQAAQLVQQVVTQVH